MVAFLVEVAALVVLAVWGWRQGGSVWTSLLIGVAVPSTAAIVWGLFAAPRSRFDVLPLEVATKVVVLGGAVAAAQNLLPPKWWVVFAGVVVLNTVLLYVGPWQR